MRQEWDYRDTLRREEAHELSEKGPWPITNQSSIPVDEKQEEEVYDMSIVKWSPMKELEGMRRDMERLFEDVFEPSRRRRHWWPKSPEGGVVVPNIDMYDRKTEIVVKAELPGVERDNIDLTITRDTITMKGESRREAEIKEEDYYSREISYGNFTRSVTLPAEVESEKAKATFKNGILEIVLPKKEEAKPKEIKVEVS
jgi:HSP20 family protein